MELLLLIFVAFVVLAYQMRWIPPKYQVADLHIAKNPLLVKIFGSENSSRKPRFIVRHTIAQYKKDGFKVVRLAFGCEFCFGRECTWTGKISNGSIQETVLMALPLK